MYRCKHCGYIHWLEEKPAICPNCKSSADGYQRLSREEQERIEGSAAENDLLLEVMSLMNGLIDETGDFIEETGAAAPIIYSIYKNATEMVQSVKAEIAKRVEEGKWG